MVRHLSRRVTSQPCSSPVGGGVPIALDFNENVETRVAAETGDVIATRDGADVVVRAANGAFRCDLTSRTCR